MRSLFAALLLAVLLFAGLCTAAPARAQFAADTLFTWKGYGQASTTRLRIYDVPPTYDRDRVIVLTELAENPGVSTLNDVQFLAENIGRQYDIDPTTAYWIVHWGAFSYEGAKPSKRKELFLRASFSRTSTGRLSSPQWRAMQRDEVRTLTDRQFP